MSLHEASLKQPLGIICNCTKYAEIVKNFKPHTIGTINPVIPKFKIGKLVSFNIKRINEFMIYTKSSTIY